MHRHIRYSLAKANDCFDRDKRKITAFTIRTTDGTDENYSSKRAEAKGTTITEELIRFSLVSYERVKADPTEEGNEVIDIKQPYDHFDEWSTKARNFVVAAWKRISTPDETEIADFFGSATESA